jgi:hypothetical protein
MSGVLYKSLLLVGLISLFAVMLFAESGPTQPFQPVFPSYNDPYLAKNMITASSFPENGTEDGVVESATGCDISFFWECVAAKDDGKYITLNGSDNGLGSDLGGYFTVNMTDISGNSVDSATVLATCRQSGTPEISMAIFQPGPTVTAFGATCASTAFADLRVAVQFGPASGCGACFPMADTTWNDFSAGLTLRLGDENTTIDVDFIQTEIQLETIGTADCPSAWDMGCQISRFFDPVSKFLTALGNVFIFGAEAAIWLGQYIANYAAVIAWLYAIPGMPIPIQVAFDAYLTVLFGAIGIELYRLIKPFGGA